VRRVTVVALLLLLAACGSTPDQGPVTVELTPGGRALFILSGDHPYVLVGNRGPGTVDVRLRDSTGSRQLGLISGGAESGMSFRGRAELSIEAEARAGAELRILVQGASRFEEAPETR
jgi:hypothetical protein